MKKPQLNPHPKDARLALFVLAAVAMTAPAVRSAAPEGEVTFTKNIAPILQRSCQRCHRPDSMAPMSLMTYEEVRPYARAIKMKTGLPRNNPDVMPPWFMERNIGIQQYKDDISLSDQEIATIAKWADSGAPRGDAADMPAPLKFADAAHWQLGTPDLIISSPSVEMAATAPDWWGPIGETPTGLTEDRYVASVEMKEVNDLAGKTDRQTIGGRFVFHHLHMCSVSPNGESERWPTHEVGRNGDVFDSEAGVLLKAGSKLDFNCGSAHLHSTGRPTKGHVEYGFRFHPRGYQAKKRVRTLDLTGTLDLDIKGMEANQRFEGFSTLPEHTKMISFEPHMHASGVRMCLDAIVGTTVETLSCSGYNHGWVRVYTYADDAAPLLPKGTILRVTGYFDNTPANKNVSDPRNWSGLGHRSMDNMMANVGQGIYLGEAEFQQELAQRRARLRLTDGQRVIGCILCATGKGPVTTTGNQQP